MTFKIPKKIKSVKFKDNRGYFQECFNKKKLNFNSVFSAMSCSKKNVIRGLHLQLKKKQEILLTVVSGKILDVCVDVNPNSNNFGKVYKNILKTGDMLYIPINFAHGFSCLDSNNLIIYQFSNYRDKISEVGIKYNDKNLNINWQIQKPILSKKDKLNISFNSFVKKIKNVRE
tara:strand:+ start:394 stop:912 length:519 start_codon:yes stop_codon:yes gene_type:complete